MNNRTVKTLTAAALLAIVAILLNGCTFQKTVRRTAIGKDGSTNVVTVTRDRIWGGYIIEHASSFFGADVETANQQTQTPSVKVGFGRDYTKLTPTASKTVYAPRASSDFEIQNAASPFSLGIKDKNATGDVAQGTNTDSTAIVPGTPANQTPPK